MVLETIKQVMVEIIICWPNLNPNSLIKFQHVMRVFFQLFRIRASDLQIENYWSIWSNGFRNRPEIVCDSIWLIQTVHSCSFSHHKTENKSWMRWYLPTVHCMKQILQLICVSAMKPLFIVQRMTFVKEQHPLYCRERQFIWYCLKYRV